MLRNVYRPVRALILAGAVLGLVLVAAVVTLGRIYMPLLGDYQVELLEQLNAHLDLQLEVGALRGEWRGLSPVVTLKDVVLKNPAAEQVFEAEHVQVAVDLLKTLLLRQPLARTVSVVNSEVLISRAQSGHWGLHGVPMADEAVPLSGLLSDFLRRIDTLELSRVTVFELADSQRRPLLGPANLLLRQGLYLSQLSLQLYQHSTQGAAVREPFVKLHGEFVGGLFNASKMRGYLALEDAQIPAALASRSHWGNSLPAGLSGELWFDWRVGKSWQAQGAFHCDEWRVDQLVGRELAPLRQLGAQFLLNGNRKVALAGQFTDLRGQLGDAQYTLASGRFSYPRSANHVNLSFGVLELEPLVQMLQHSTLLPSPLAASLEVLQPRGRLRDAHLRVPLARTTVDDFALLARAADVSVLPWKVVPGVSSVDGVLSMTLEHGALDLDGSAVALDFPRLFSHQLPFERVAGRVDWQLRDRLGSKHLSVGSRLLQARGDFGVASVNFALEVPLQRREAYPPALTLQAGVQQSRVEFIDRFLPFSVSADLRAWLRQSVREGSLEQVGFIYHGSLRKGQPLDKTVQLFSHVSNGQLRFLPRWPVLRDIEVDLVVADTRVIARSPRAMILGSEVTGALINYEPDSAGSQRLEIGSELQGSARDLITLFTDTPLADATGGAFADWQASGRYQASLQLGISPGDWQVEDVSVDGLLQGIDIAHPDLGINLVGTSGALHYDGQQGLRARSLRTRLWGQPMRATLAPGPAQADGVRSLRIEALAPVVVSRLPQQLAIPVLQRAAGRSDWYATLDIYPRASGQASRLQLNSDLNGVALDLPRPFGKTAEQVRTLDIAIEFDAAPRRGELRYANLVKARYQADGSSARAGIWLGGLQEPLLPKSGVRVSGQLDRVVVQDWLGLLGQSRRWAPAVGAPLSLLLVDDLQIRELDVFGQLLRRPELGLSRVDGQWQLGLQHPRVSGRLRMAQGDAPYQLHFDHLRLPLDGTAAPAVQHAGKGRSRLGAVDPGSLPRALVQIDDLQVGAKALGRWSFATLPAGDTLEVSDLKIHLAGASFAGLGNRSEGARFTWSRTGDEHTTALRGTLRADDFNQLLNRLGYDSGIVSDSAKVRVDFRWDAPPDQLALAGLTGEMALRLKDGQLRQTSGTPAEALRVLGILNVNYLARRLRLDFSDLYKSGLSYDSIRGVLHLDKGQLHLSQPLLVEGPSSQLTLRGDFDLLREKIDAELVVQLPITSNLPWMVALTLPGGIPIAAGVYVAGRVFERQLESLTSVVYHLAGSLDDPEVSFKHLADAGDSQQEAPSRAARRDRTGARR